MLQPQLDNRLLKPLLVQLSAAETLCELINFSILVEQKLDNLNVLTL